MSERQAVISVSNFNSEKNCSTRNPSNNERSDNHDNCDHATTTKSSKSYCHQKTDNIINTNTINNIDPNVHSMEKYSENSSNIFRHEFRDNITNNTENVTITHDINQTIDNLINNIIISDHYHKLEDATSRTTATYDNHSFIDDHNTSRNCSKTINNPNNGSSSSSIDTANSTSISTSNVIINTTNNTINKVITNHTNDINNTSINASKSHTGDDRIIAGRATTVQEASLNSIVPTPPPEPQAEPALQNQVAGAIAGSLIHFALGAIVGLSGVVLPEMTNSNSSDLVLSAEQAALFSSLMNIGAMAGSVTSGPLMIFLGQRITLLVALPLAAVGWFLLAFTPSVWLLQVARILLGFVSGIYGGPSANYVAEISHTSVRGRLTGLVDLLRQLGFLFVYVVGSSGLSWRQTAMVCGATTTIIPFLFLIFLPNSPRWLATRSRFPEARQSLKFYRGKNYAVDVELEDISEQLRVTSKTTSIAEQLKVLRKRPVLKIISVLIFMFFAYQFCGNFSMIVFSVTIFQSAQSNIDGYTSTIIVGAVRVLGVLAYISLADKIGRRSLLISSLVLSSLAMSVMGLYFYLKVMNVVLTQIQWLPLASMGVFIFFTCIAEPALILLRAELLPTAIRSVGVPIIYVFFFSGAFLVSYLYPFMVDKIGSHGTFWIYAADGIIMAVVGTIFIPETLAKSLEDIEKTYRPPK